MDKSITINNALLSYASALEKKEKALSDKVELLELEIKSNSNIQHIKELEFELKSMAAENKAAKDEIASLKAQLKSSKEMLRQARNGEKSAKAEAEFEAALRGKVASDLSSSKVTNEELKSLLVEMASQQVKDSQMLEDILELCQKTFDMESSSYSQQKVAAFNDQVKKIDRSRISGEDLDILKVFMFEHKDNGKGLTGIVELILSDDKCTIHKYFCNITKDSALNKISRYAKLLFNSTDVSTWTMDSE